MLVFMLAWGRWAAGGVSKLSHSCSSRVWKLSETRNCYYYLEFSLSLSPFFSFFLYFFLFFIFVFFSFLKSIILFQQSTQCLKCLKSVALREGVNQRSTVQGEDEAVGTRCLQRYQRLRWKLERQLSNFSSLPSILKLKKTDSATTEQLKQEEGGGRVFRPAR